MLICTRRQWIFSRPGRGNEIVTKQVHAIQSTQQEDQAQPNQTHRTRRLAGMEVG